MDLVERRQLRAYATAVESVASIEGDAFAMILQVAEPGEPELARVNKSAGR